MKRPLLKSLALCLASGLLLTACSNSITRPVSSIGTAIQPNDSSVTVFLLERDIPKEIQRLGIVTITPVTSNVPLAIDKQVKQQLRADCKRLGANGAYRISDGTYPPLAVSYLVFKFDN